MMDPFFGRPQAVFLDRDGVINEEVNLLHDVSQLRLIPGSAKAIRRLNMERIPVIVATNQPVVARNLCTEEELQNIHKALEKEIRLQAQARLDAIYYCPHHPETHHPEGNPAYRISCDCRKPNIGMLLKAAKEFHLDLSRCVFVGDSTRDILAGKRAGMRTVLLQTGYGGEDRTHEVSPDRVCRDLAEAVDVILKGEIRTDDADAPSNT